MISEAELRDQIISIEPWFFPPPGGATERPDIVNAWPLPAGRVLFACTEQWRYQETSASTIRLYVIDPRRSMLRTVGAVTGVASAELAVAVAVWWMQGLRSEDLSGVEQSMLDYLGELAWRMSFDQLRVFALAYFSYPSEAWGTVDNPNPVPDDRLGELLESLGFTKEYLAAHWQQ